MKRNNIQFVNEKASVKVDALTGQGSTKVWKQMLLQMHNLSPDMADAIIKMYPTIHALMSAYQGCSCKDGENLLADIVIRRGFGTLLNNRKIGPELSKRIYKMMTCQNGSEIL
uniref:ERCC4 domain-containing protein n=1 Tax=Ciona savignyi TaxID=51511 RepID=H2ZQR2_CIOSA